MDERRPSASQESSLGVGGFRSARDEAWPSASSSHAMRAAQESFLQADKDKRVREQEEAVRREAQETCASKVGQVTAVNEDGSLEIDLSDGQTLSRVQNVSRIKWGVGFWVTIERVGGSSWQVVGPAPWGAGHPGS